LLDKNMRKGEPRQATQVVRADENKAWRGGERLRRRHIG
jgi:hypothetical protein